LSRGNPQLTLDLWVGHIVGFMDALDIPKAHFIGNSFGGALTLGVGVAAPSSSRPHGVDGLGGTGFSHFKRIAGRLGLRTLAGQHAKIDVDVCVQSWTW